MTNALKQYVNTRGNTFPSLFSSSYLDEILNMIEEPAKWYPTQTAYPYNVEEYKDKNGRVLKTILTFALAGVKKEDINISVVDNSLSVKVEKHETERTVPEDEHHWVTRHKGISQRALNLKFTLHDVDEEKITSRFENGLLEVTLPSVEHKTHTIKID